MSRRYSDAPINLIARIPTPEQISAARPKQRSFSQLLVESGATCVRGIAELVAQFHRLGRSVGSSISDRPVGSASFGQADAASAGDTRSVTETAGLSDARSSADIAEQGSTVAPVRMPEKAVEAAPVRVSLPKPSAVESVPLDEVIALRSELVAHQQEVARLSDQLQELKSMIGSQQQVLVYLGQELETQQMPIRSAAAQAAPPAKKARVVRSKSASKALSALRTSPCEPSLNL